MKIISHRGNIKGLNPRRENSPSYIDCAIQLGYDVEIDIRFLDDILWLGHDEPQYKVEINWLLSRKEKIWVHCKNLEACSFLSRHKNDINYFSHSHDPVVLVSNGMTWVHDLSLKLDENCVIPLLSKEDIDLYQGTDKIHAVCTDDIFHIKNKFAKLEKSCKS